MSDSVALFEQERPRLAKLAYGMLGTHADTDDVLQEAFLRWSRLDPLAVDVPAAMLTTIVTRLCIDRRREIDRRKESYIGAWLPDPVLDPVPPADRAAEVSESVSLAFLYLLELLSPAERAAYLLRKVFNYDYESISEVLEKSVVQCRQLVSRAQHRLLEKRPRFRPQPDDHARITNQFLQTCASGDMAGLLELLSEDVVLVSDGGGKVPAALRPIHGSDHVARFFLGVYRKAPASASALPVLVNGSPGFASLIDGQLTTVCAFDVEEDRIRACYIVRNPEKLQRAARMLELTSAN